MPMASGVYYRIRTYPSGKKVRLAISESGRILESMPVLAKTHRSKTGRRLAARRRRIR
jgi:hypothetical protein